MIPQESVVENIELSRSGSYCDCLDLRGEALSLVRLPQMFEVGEPPPQRQNVVVAQYAGFGAGIVADRLMGELQTVIEPPGPACRDQNGLSGSTTLGCTSKMIVAASMASRSSGR